MLKGKAVFCWLLAMIPVLAIWGCEGEQPQPPDQVDRAQQTVFAG